MAAASLDAPAYEVRAATPLAPHLVSAQKFFPDHLFHLVHLDPLDAACTGDFRPVHLVLVDASADPDAGHSDAADFLEWCLAPDHDSPCALASEDVSSAVVAAAGEVDPVLRGVNLLARPAVENAALKAELPLPLPLPVVLAAVVQPGLPDGFPDATAQERQFARGKAESLQVLEFALPAVLARPTLLEVPNAWQPALKEQMELPVSPPQGLQVLQGVE